MKKIYLIFGIFLLLIGFSSFSWAYSNYRVNNSVFNTQFNQDFVDFDLSAMLEGTYGNIEFTDAFVESLRYCFTQVEVYSNHVVYESRLSTTPFYVDGYNLKSNNPVISVSLDTQYDNLRISGYSSENYPFSFYTYFDVGSVYYLTNAPFYTDNTYTTEYSANNIRNYGLNTTTFLQIGSSSGGEGGEGGEGGDNNDSVTNTSLAEILLSVVVPTGEDWEDLQNTFEDTLLSKFHITAMSFDDDLTYSWGWGGTATPLDSAPTFTFGEWGSIDLSAINDLMHTPLSFGAVRTAFGSTVGAETVPTAGITLYDVINFLLILDIFICNIVLYNKFFNKGG